MGFFNSGIIAGLDRADGVTARNVTMNRVGSIQNGFVAREIGLENSELAQTLTHRTFEEKARNGMRIRTSQTVWTWPYDVPAEPGVVAGVITWNRNGLHVPANCPAFVRADVLKQLQNMAQVTSGTVGKQLVVDPLTADTPPA
jgi:hypothetical protein